MHAMITVRWLGIWSVEVVWRPRHVTVRGALVRLPRPPPAQRLVCMVEPTPHDRQALVPGVIQRTVGLGLP